MEEEEERGEKNNACVKTKGHCYLVVMKEHTSTSTAHTIKWLPNRPVINCNSMPSLPNDVYNFPVSNGKV